MHAVSHVCSYFIGAVDTYEVLTYSLAGVGALLLLAIVIIVVVSCVITVNRRRRHVQRQNPEAEPIVPRGRQHRNPLQHDNVPDDEEN